jgi:superfamily II DNA or RNA helicase
MSVVIPLSSTCADETATTKAGAQPVLSLSFFESRIRPELTFVINPNEPNACLRRSCLAFRHMTSSRSAAAVALPLRYALSLSRPDLHFTSYTAPVPMPGKFAGQLRPEQLRVVNASMQHLTEARACIIEAAVGFGKTILATYMLTVANVPSLVIVNRIILLEQWCSAIRTFAPGLPVTAIMKDYAAVKCDPSAGAQVFVVNAINVSKLSRELLASVKIVVVDELHLIMSNVLSKSLLHVQPLWLLGLSATPYRLDGLDAMIAAFFGTRRVAATIKRKCAVYTVKTALKPPVSYKYGKINWHAVLDAQMLDDNRNRMIVDIVKSHPSRVFLLLVKRVAHAKLLSKLLDAEGIAHDVLTGATAYTETDNRVLIGTVSKCGTGFDAAKLNTLVLCSDVVNYYSQVLGRIMRRCDGDSVVFDIVDDNPILKKHYADRCTVYREVNAQFWEWNSQNSVLSEH